MLLIDAGCDIYVGELGAGLRSEGAKSQSDHDRSQRVNEMLR